MKTKTNIKQYLLICLAGFFTAGCYDNEPKVENLPSADVAFTYKIINDEKYQLDYYVGSAVEFTSISKMEGECVWDFGYMKDGKPVTAVGKKVTHEFEIAGTYRVKLTVAGAKNKTQPIMIKDILPIMRLEPVEGGVYEVRNPATPVNISVELPNPRHLKEEYVWTFPDGTTDELGNKITGKEDVKNPGEEPDKEIKSGKLVFRHVGSQTVKLQVKLGGRLLEEGVVKVPVGYTEAVPTLYYAVRGGNIMALKLVSNKPADMNIYPFDMGVSAGKHPLNILFSDSTLFILDCGLKFTYTASPEGEDAGDGRIIVMKKDGSKVETMLTNVGGHAFNDPFYGCIDGGNLYFSDRLTGFTKLKLTDRNKIYVAPQYKAGIEDEFPFYVRGDRLGYNGKGMGFASLNAGFGRINGVWYWCKTNAGSGVYRFLESDILPGYNSGTADVPGSGVVLEGVDPKAVAWDSKNQMFYFTLNSTSFGGLYGCTMTQLDAIGAASDTKLAPLRLKTANGKSVTPVVSGTVIRDRDGAAGEYIGICQLAVDEATGNVYFGYRTSNPDDIKSGLMRYNRAKNIIEHVPLIEGIEIFGVAVNNNKSKLF